MTKVEMFAELHNAKAEIVKAEFAKVKDQYETAIRNYLASISCNWEIDNERGRGLERIYLKNPLAENGWDSANIDIWVDEKWAKGYTHVDHRELKISSTSWSSIKSFDVKVIEYYKTLAKILDTMGQLEKALNEIDQSALEHARDEMYEVGRELEAEKNIVAEAEKAAKVAEITSKLVAGAELVMNATSDGRYQYKLKIEKVTAKMVYLNNYTQRRIAEVVECIIKGEIKVVA